MRLIISLMHIIPSRLCAGIYELQMPLEFRAVVNLGCLAGVERAKAGQLRGQDVDTFELSWLQFKTLASYQYLEPDSYKYVYLYHHRTATKSMWGFIVPAQKKGTIFVVDTVRSNQLPGLTMWQLRQKRRWVACAPGRRATRYPADIAPT